MIMELPKKFNMESYAKVKDGMLYIYNTDRIEDLMYELAYATKKRRCVYCGKKLKRTNSTMDHRYPRDSGGVSIVNNLYPTCPICNSHKSNLLHQEYLKTLDLPKREKKKEIKKFYKDRENIFKRIGFMLPKRWVTYINLEDIQCRESRQDLRGKKYYRIVEFWQKYHKLPRPVLLDRNNKLLDGYNTIIFARDVGIKTIPCIKLENVEIV